MAGTLSLTVGTATATVPIRGTNAQINAAIRRYALAKGIEVEGRSATQVGEDVLRSLLRHVRDVSIDQQRLELLAAQAAEREAQIGADNDIVEGG